MNFNILNFLFENYTQKILKKIQVIVDSINNLESKFKKLSDVELKKKQNFLNIV